MLTVGVEEEFLLLEPDGAVAPVAADVARLAAASDRIVPEYMAYQVETVTGVCSRLDELRAELVGLRQLAAQSAERVGVRLVAAGAAPLGAGPVGALADGERYRELARRFPDATAAGGACACHVHVGIPERDLAVEVLTRLRPWLPVLLALTVNSPFSGGADSGWSSTRYRGQLRWPSFRPPEAWAGAHQYDQAVSSVIAHGAAMDPASVYFLARLSARYPTVEIRVADACLTVDDSLLLAGVARALVASLIDDAGRGDRIAPSSTARVSASLLAAAHHGMSTRGTRMRDRPEVAVDGLIARLLAKITPALDAAGDTADVIGGLKRFREVGTGADRQRALWRDAAGPETFVASLADATLPRTAKLTGGRTRPVPLAG